MRYFKFFITFFLFLFTALGLTSAQEKSNPIKIDSYTFGAIEARAIGPAVMSGRIMTIDAVVTNPNIIYVGAASGGVWKSIDAGVSFKPIFDKFTQSIGDITIDQTHPDTIWVGTGESDTRNSVSVGTGIYKSTDGGDNWSSVESRIFSNGNVNCNGVDAAYNSIKGLLVVWSEKVTVEKVSHYESYFNRFDGDDWTDFSNITDTLEVVSGGFPTVATSYASSTHRAHVTINTGNADLWNNNQGRNYSRDYDYTDWSDPTAILPSDSVLSKMDRLLVTDDGYIHSFYYTHTGGLPGFKYSRKLVTSSTWGSDTSTIEATVIGSDNLHNIPIAKTSGDTLHAIWLNAGPFGIYYKKKHSSATSWSSEPPVKAGGSNFQDVGVCSASNDLFVMFASGVAGYYKIRQYDDIPLAPQNLTVDRSGNNHPLLEWTENYEPDLNKYYIYRYDTYGGGWQYLTQTSNEEYEDTTLTYCTAAPPAKCADERNFYYRITAVDLQSHESEPSDSVVARLVGGSPDKKSANNNDIAPTEYSLQQNFPNPFNPTTQINYSIKESGLVTLNVYDVLGSEVAVLVNEKKSPGYYSVNFDAGNLPSGIYIYKLTARVFTDTKKLILLK